MGLLTLLLTFPVSGPVMVAKAAIQTVVGEAEKEFYDEGLIQRQLAEAERQLQAGEIDDEEFAQVEENLLERLLESRRRRQQAEREGSDG